MSYTSRWSFKKLLLWWLLRSTGSFPRQIRLAEKGQARSQIGRKKGIPASHPVVYTMLLIFCVFGRQSWSLSCLVQVAPERLYESNVVMTRKLFAINRLELVADGEKGIFHLITSDDLPIIPKRFQWRPYVCPLCLGISSSVTAVATARSQLPKRREERERLYYYARERESRYLLTVNHQSSRKKQRQVW